MTQTEAISKLEDWLLIPVGIENVLPALVALKGTSDFQEYLQKVADADYRTVAEVAREVDACERKLAKPCGASLLDFLRLIVRLVQPL